MKQHFCWKCRTVMPFLEENEWEQVSPLLEGAKKAIQEYREENNCSLQTAREFCKPEAMLKFEELTGKPNVHFEIICHHRLKNWGQECPECGHLLRTPKAKYCAKCGWIIS